MTMPNRFAELAAGRALRPLLATALFALCATACSNRQVYETLQSWQAERCERTISEDDRARCLQAASDSYDAYRRQREEDKRGEREPPNRP
ncbi:MAG: hypothetical protein AB7V26_11480 [Lysobacterales bacterium]